MRCLVAEDDPVSRRLLATVLERRGWEVEAACDGAEAWSLLSRRNEPTLAILDWMMPGLDGLEVCRRVRATPALRGSYLILLTARTQHGDVVAGLEAGADDHLGKPFHPGELLARLGTGERILSLQRDLAVRVSELEKALAAIRTLQGMLPICCYCKRIRGDDQYWQQVEEYVAAHTRAEFTHGICPDCLIAQFGIAGAADAHLRHCAADSASSATRA